MNKFKEHSDLLALLLIIIAFVIYKFPLLNIPYYWDEAWSYKPAIEEMVKNSSTLLPNATSSEIYKGHPLFFYFITSLWLKLFGNTIFVSKTFALLVSILLLITSFFTSKTLSNNKLAPIFTVLLLIVQSIFIAQSTLVLPEMLLALLSLLTLLFYFKKKQIAYIIFGSLVLLTKETGIVLFVSIFISNILFNISSIKNNFFKYIKDNYYLVIPIIPMSLFFVLQKLTTAWFFYPEHINYIEFGNAFYNKLESFSGLLFIYQGRNLVFFILIILSVYLIFKKIKIEKHKELVTLLIFIVLYIIFSSINFFSPRYILSLIPVFTIIAITIINISLVNKILRYSIIAIIIISPLYYSLTHNADFDHTIGYENVVDVQKQMIDYCEQKNYYDKNISTGFLLSVNMTDSIMGYLSSCKKFNKLQTQINDSTEFVIISTNNQIESINNYIKTNNCQQIISFEKKQAWCRLFLINRSSKN